MHVISLPAAWSTLSTMQGATIKRPLRYWLKSKNMDQLWVSNKHYLFRPSDVLQTYCMWNAKRPKSSIMKLFLELVYDFMVLKTLGSDWTLNLLTNHRKLKVPTTLTAFSWAQVYTSRSLAHHINVITCSVVVILSSREQHAILHPKWPVLY